MSHVAQRAAFFYFSVTKKYVFDFISNEESFLISFTKFVERSRRITIVFYQPNYLAIFSV